MLKTSCPYCGNNPANHLASWVMDFLMIIFTPFSDLIFRGTLGKWFYKMIDYLLWGMVWIYEKLGVVRYTTDLSKSNIDRARVLWEEAERRGIKMKGAVLGARYADLYQAKVKGHTILFNGLPRPQSAENANTFTLDDKAILKTKLQSAGIPTPPGGCFVTLNQALWMFEGMRKPVIVKPRLGSRGRHTTTYIYTASELARAFQIAKQICFWVIMEEQLFGDVYRGTVINGKLVGVLAGAPPKITGDGLSTIQELINQKNQNKPSSIKEVGINQSMIEFLKRQNLHLDSVLPAGKMIDLTEKIGVSYGGNSREVTDVTHPSIKVWLEKTAALINDPILGFDFIIDDVTKFAESQRWGIIECNGLPFINLHHNPHEGKPNNVAKYVWDMIEQNIE